VIRSRAIRPIDLFLGVSFTRRDSSSLFLRPIDRFRLGIDRGVWIRSARETEAGNKNETNRVRR